MNHLSNYSADQLQGLLDLLLDAKTARHISNRETFQQGVDYNFWTDEIIKARIEKGIVKRVNDYDHLDEVLITTIEKVKI